MTEKREAGFAVEIGSIRFRSMQPDITSSCLENRLIFEARTLSSSSLLAKVLSVAVYCRCKGWLPEAPHDVTNLDVAISDLAMPQKVSIRGLKFIKPWILRCGGGGQIPAPKRSAPIAAMDQAAFAIPPSSQSPASQQSVRAGSWSSPRIRGD